MSRQLTTLVANTPYQTWFNLTNSIVSMLANEVLTANTGGAMTVGNGFVTGVFGANTIVGTSLQGGNTSVSANLTITTNCNASVGLQINNIVQLNINTTTTGTNSQIIDYWPIASYRSAEYTLSIKNTTANGYQLSKVLVLQDGVNTYQTEFGVLASNGYLGIFSAAANTTNVLVSFTPSTNSTTIQGLRTVVSI